MDCNSGNDNDHGADDGMSIDQDDVEFVLKCIEMDRQRRLETFFWVIDIDDHVQIHVQEESEPPETGWN